MRPNQPASEATPDRQSRDCESTTQRKPTQNRQGCAVRVRVLKTVSELEEVRNIWTAWQYHPNADPDFFFTLNALRPQIARPHVVVLYRDGQPDAMFIGRIVDEQMRFTVGYKTILAQRARLLNIVYGGLLGTLSRENCDVLLAEIQASLARGEVDAVRFKGIPVGSDLFLASAHTGPWLTRDNSIRPNEHWRLNLPGTYSDFLQTRSSSVRKQMRYCAKRFREAYGNQMTIKCYRTYADLDRMCADMEAVTTNTYHRGLGIGFADNAETRGLLAMALQHGWQHSYVLYIGATPCAFYDGLLYRNSYFVMNTAYDPAFEKHRPGVFLLGAIIEQLCLQGAHSIDFGFGDAIYKRWHSNDNWQEAPVYFFANTLLGLKLNALRTLTTAADTLAKNALARTKALDPIKKMWRKRFAGTVNTT